MNYLRIAAIAFLVAFGFNVNNVTATTPPTPSITNVTAATRVVWAPNGNGYNRCVSFADYGPAIFGEKLVVKHWLTAGYYVAYESLIAPNRTYKWRIANGVFYLRWLGIETPYLIHPHGTTAEYGYVIQIMLPDVVVKVNGLPGEFKLGGKVPLVPISGGSGEFTFTGAADFTTASPLTPETGLWFRPIKAVSITK